MKTKHNMTYLSFSQPLYVGLHFVQPLILKAPFTLSFWGKRKTFFIQFRKFTKWFFVKNAITKVEDCLCSPHNS